ncbi:hypothetical protein GCM10022233_42610 [Streptomyces shaanxiensis]|uniref:Uncharacterized protein n=1 Tax=Streptomyces shaanxiensis TaxID=653357 RepID=A0ABP7VBY6_9ACTN
MVAGGGFGGGLQVVQPRFEARAEGRGRGGHVCFDLGAGPGFLGVDVQATLDLAEGPQVDALVDTQPLTCRGTAPMSMWSATRDKQCPGGEKPAADATCSSVLQEKFAFSKAFAAYN